MKRWKTLLIIVLLVCLVVPTIVNAEWHSLGSGSSGGSSSSSGDSGGSSSGYSSSSGGSWSNWSSSVSASTSDYTSWRSSGGSGEYSWVGSYEGGGTYEVHINNGGGGDSYGGGGGSWGGGGPVCTDYTETIDAPDFEISKVVPLVIKQSQKALIAVNIHNIGRLEGTTDVTVSIGTEKVTMSNVRVPAGNHALSFGYYTAKMAVNQPITVTVNPSHPAQAAPYTTTCNTCGGCGYTYQQGAEYSYSNNSWTGTLTINKNPDIANPKDPAPRPNNPRTFIESLPKLTVSPTGGTGASRDTYTGVDGKTTTIGNNRTNTTWVDSTPTGADKLYSAKLDMTVKVLDRTKDCTVLKSGYGFALEVTCKVTTDYPVTEKVEAPKKVLCYIPDFGKYEYAIPLERTDGGNAYARTTTWELPENKASQTAAKKWYVPTWWADGTNYNFLVAAKGVYTPGGELTAASVHTIKIDSNMYTDDYSVN